MWNVVWDWNLGCCLNISLVWHCYSEGPRNCYKGNYSYCRWVHCWNVSYIWYSLYFEWAGESWNCGIVDLCCRKIDLCLTFEILTVIPILVFIILMWMHNVGCGLFHAIVLIDD